MSTNPSDDDFLFAEDGSDGAKKPERKAVRAAAGALPWKVLVVDDDPEVYNITALVLKDVVFRDRPLKLFSANSSIEARRILEKEKDIAVVLLDVVMETENAGLNFVKTIREDLKNSQVRIILRTGQPGQAPERDVIVNYDINDYRAKTEMTSQKLFSSTISALRSYEDIVALTQNRRGLEMILNATSTLFQKRRLRDFAQGVLTQLETFVAAGSSNGILCVRLGDMDGTDVETPHILAGSGKYAELAAESVDEKVDDKARASIDRCLQTKKNDFYEGGTTIYIRTPNEREMAVHLDNSRKLSDMEIKMLDLFSRKIAVGMDNLYLIEHLRDSHEATVVVLAALAEYKDTDTGEHIIRVAKTSESIARKLRERGVFTDQLSESFISQIGPASMLHDVGKVSIPDRILLKPGKLEPDERIIMETHAANGGEILKRGAAEVDEGSYLLLGAEVAMTHHEHFDGQGYPSGLAGRDIPLSGRIVAVADVFDALVSRRPYKEPWPVEKAVEYIKERSGKQFDPHVVEAFLEAIEDDGVSIPL